MAPSAGLASIDGNNEETRLVGFHDDQKGDKGPIWQGIQPRSFTHRVKVENVIRRLKIFRILRERYRDRGRGYGIKLNIIAGIVNLKMGYRAKIR
jgi:hypothetical protein